MTRVIDFRVIRDFEACDSEVTKHSQRDVRITRGEWRKQSIIEEEEEELKLYKFLKGLSKIFAAIILEEKAG
ncbi:hypothetical protein CRYUN_Cryun28dG0032600 [Craigia yunnanensis]